MAGAIPSGGIGSLAFDLTAFDVTGAQQTQIFGVNDHGQMVGSYNDGSVDHGFLYDKGVVTPLDFPGAQNTELLGINNSGRIVGVMQGGVVGGKFYSVAWFLLLDGTYTLIGPSGSTASFSVGQIAGINNEGAIVAGTQQQGGFLLQAGQYTILPISNANGVNSSLRIVGADSGQGVILSGGQTEFIAYPGAAGPTFGMGLNDESDVVGFYSTAPGVLEHGFVFSAGKFTTVDFPGAAQTLIFGISANASIVGAYMKSGITHGFIGTKKAS